MKRAGNRRITPGATVRLAGGCAPSSRSSCLLVLAPAAAAAPNVEIRRTSHGIPHIKAQDFDGVGYGYGYAFAQDNLCEIADTLRDGRRRALALLRARRELREPRQRHDAEQPQLGLLLPADQDDRVVEKLLAQPPPAGPLPEITRGRRAATSPATTPTCARPASTGSPTRAAAARRGCGRSPSSTSTGASTSSRCWPARAWRSTASARGAAADAGRPRRRAAARRPSSRDAARDGSRSATSAPTPSRSARRRPSDGNGPAARQPALPVGRARALLPGPPHDPGQVDVAGASLFGVPLVLIGHTRGWPGATPSRPRSASRRSSSSSCRARPRPTSSTGSRRR